MYKNSTTETITYDYIVQVQTIITGYKPASKKCWTLHLIEEVRTIQGYLYNTYNTCLGVLTHIVSIGGFRDFPLVFFLSPRIWNSQSVKPNSCADFTQCRLYSRPSWNFLLVSRDRHLLTTIGSWLSKPGWHWWCSCDFEGVRRRAKGRKNLGSVHLNFMRLLMMADTWGSQTNRQTDRQTD